MALPGIRQSLMYEDPEFNLGMSGDAFANLGMGELAAIQDLGLMSLPGANTTVANPNVTNALVDQTQLARELFDTYVTGFNPNQDALNFWGNKISTMGQEQALNEFLRPSDPNAPRLAMMRQDPDFVRATAPREIIDQDWEGDRNRFTPVADMSTPYVEPVQKLTAPIVPAQDMPPEPMEIVDRKYLGSSANIARQELAAAQPAVEAGPKFEGKPYDPAAYNTVLKQLTAQQQALSAKGVPYTSTFGGASETIQDMAKRLAAMGISDIRDFGMKHELPVEKVYETIAQDEGPSMTFDTGKYRTISGFKGYDAERNPIFDYRELTPEEVEKLRFDKKGVAFLPTDQIKRADLVNTPYAGTVYYNKKTGEPIDTRQFGGKAESGLFASSGAGEGYTNYRVVYDEKTGTPIFLPEKELSGMKEFVAKDLPGILSVLKFIPGAQIPVTIAQAAAAAYMGAKPEDILKSVGTSLIAGNMDKLLPAALQQVGILDKPMWDDYLGKFVGGTPTTDLGKIALKAGESGLASLVQGASLEDALKSAAIGGAGQGLSGLLPESKPGDINYTKLLTAAAPAIARGELTNADLFRIISALAQPTKKRRPGTP